MPTTEEKHQVNDLVSKPDWSLIPKTHIKGGWGSQMLWHVSTPHHHSLESNPLSTWHRVGVHLNAWLFGWVRA